ncbi:MAG: ion channel [Nocardioidaceae bacterium]|mgnify:CR=1 FL=1
MSRAWLRALVPPAGLLVLYFAVPFDGERAPVGVLVGILLTAVAVAALAVVVLREVGRTERRLTAVHLVLALEAVLMTFSLAYYLVATSWPHQFVGLETRLDALYFSTTTMTTVGYGDVHAAGQVARGLVTAQLVFNLVFVAAFAGLLKDRLVADRGRADDRAEEEGA